MAARAGTPERGMFGPDRLLVPLDRAARRPTARLQAAAIGQLPAVPRRRPGVGGPYCLRDLPYRTGANAYLRNAYLRQLAAACVVAGARGVTCIGSGLSCKRLVAFAGPDAIRRGDLIDAR